MKYYISQTIVESIDGRITGREVVITRADSRVDPEGARHKNVKRYMQKLRALGIENLHINQYEKKRYSKLVREQNKYRKDKKLTVADLAKMVEQAEELEKVDER
jgi:hypothetical protein